MKPILIISASVLVCVYTSYSPQQVMVDVTNDFGICVLQLVSSRRENVAFSPYGLVSVGLVLYEGANGPTAAEIHNTLRLPWDRHITRIGFRDLHRYLKSYFTNDGFLRGLVLSKPNVILHWNYTRQLQFYGFDLKPADTTTKVPTTTVLTTSVEPSQTLTPNAPSTTTTETSRTTTPLITTQQPSTFDIKTTETMKQDTEPPKTTTPTTNIVTDTETTKYEDVSKITSTSPPITNAATTVKEKEETKEPTTTQKVESTVSPLTEPVTTNIVTETTKTDKTTETTLEMEGREDDKELTVVGDQNKETTTVQTQNAETTSELTTMPAASQTTTMPAASQTTTNSPEVTTPSLPESTKTEDVNGKETTLLAAETTARETAASFPSTVPPTPTQPSTVTLLETEAIQSTVQGTSTPASTIAQTPISETVPSTETAGTSYSTVGETSVTPETSTAADNALTNEVTTQQTTQSETESETETSRKKRAVYSKGNVPEHREGISNWVPHYQDPRWNYHAPLENWFFSYSGGERVPIITYSAYLPFAYLGDLATLALQLPLDDPRYYMLILLPEDRNGLEKLLYSLQWCPIRGILDQLKTTAVYATVPVFTIVKHVNLVPALAKLGILSVFDPSTADLSAMSSEKGIFVRTIEQVVTVSLRKYFANYRWFEAKPGEVEQHFIANHPFAYFVLDKETQVTLMTGTIVNPIAYNQ